MIFEKFEPYFNKKINRFYYLNKKNFIKYRIKDDVMIAMFFRVMPKLDYNDIKLLLDFFFTNITKNYENINYVVNYRGTLNPLFAKAILQKAEELNTCFDVFYDNQKIKDLDKIKRYINIKSKEIKTWKCNENCRFKEFSVAICLRKNMKMKSILKSYEINEQGLLKEYDPDKENKENTYIGLDIPEGYEVRIQDDKITYYKKKK